MSDVSDSTYSNAVGDEKALPTSLVDMLSTMVGSSSPLTESNTSATSSEKGSTEDDSRIWMRAQSPLGESKPVSAGDKAPSPYLNTPLNANELNASNDVDPLTFLPQLMESDDTWPDMLNRNESVQPLLAARVSAPTSANASTSLPSTTHLQPRPRPPQYQAQQDISNGTSTASLFGQKVLVTGKHQPVHNANCVQTSNSSHNVLERALESQQHLGVNHPVVNTAVPSANAIRHQEKMQPYKATITSNSGAKKPRRRIRHLTEKKRVERNSKEQERSHQINHQFSELRQLLSANGIVVPKGTKNAVLEITLEYIRVLRARQQQLERNNDMLALEVQGIARGRAGEEAARALQHAAAKNGVQAALASARKILHVVPNDDDPKSILVPAEANNGINIVVADAFEHAPVGTAIASMGGSILDCNACFRRCSNITREELCKLTVFNLIARDQLQGAFSQLSEMLTPDDNGCPQKSLVFQSTFSKNAGLRISFINDNEGKKQLICITLQRWEA